MRLVKFKMRHPPYTTGETAGFPEEVAERLVTAGIVTYYTPPETEAGDKPDVEETTGGRPKPLKKKQMESADGEPYVTK